MPLDPNADLQFWLSVNNPEDDTAQSGGAIQDDAHGSGGILALFTDIAADTTTVDTVRAVSDGSDTRNLTITGRTLAGVITSETLALTNATPITFTTSFQRILKVVLASKSASRTVTVTRVTGGANIVTLGINVLAARRMFYDSASDPVAIKTRYELLYIKNKSVTNALLSGQVNLSADPETVIEMGISLTVNTDESAIANRLAVPGGIVFTDVGTQNIPGGGTLNTGQRCGLWLKQTLSAGRAAIDSTVSVKVAGSTS